MRVEKETAALDLESTRIDHELQISALTKTLGIVRDAVEEMDLHKIVRRVDHELSVHLRRHLE